MAINKNFVVKNGLEVNTNLILADANSNKVGIASTAPRTELDVRGGIAATDLNITGVATIATLRATTGIVTNFDGVNLNVSGVGTIATFESTTSTIQNLNATNLDVSGIGTIGVGVVTNLSGTNLNYSGIGTVTTLTGTSVQISNLNATGVSTIASLSVTDSTFEILTVNQYTNLLGVTTIANATGTNLNFSGVGTFASIDINGGDLEVANLDATDINVTGVSTLTNATGTNLNFSGVGTFATVDINGGDIEVSNVDTTDLNVTGVSTLGTFKISSGIITATSGVVTYYGDGSKLTNIVSGVGISSLGTLIGTGATILNFVGTALSTITISSGIATIKLDAGEGVTPGGSDGQVQYNGGGGFAASSNFTFDGSNVNIAGVVTATSFDGSNVNIAGVVTATSFTGSGSGITGLTNSNLSGSAGITNANLANSTISGVSLGSNLNTLTMNTSGTGLSGSTTYNGSGASTFTVTSNATSANTASAIVARDASGNFTAGTITASLSGTASNANTLDSIDSTQFLRSDTADQKTSGNLRFNDSIQLNFGTGDDAELFCDGSNLYLDLNSSGVTSWIVRDGTTNRFTFARSTGTFTATGDINSSSDMRLKTNIKTLTNSLEKVLSMRGVEYDRIDLGGKHQIGVIAQEIEKIAPDLVSEDENGFKSVSYGNITALLIEAVKELSAKVKELESKNQ